MNTYCCLIQKKDGTKEKMKKIICGIAALTIMAPLTLNAEEIIPLKFKEGDVISANVINNLFKRLSDAQKGFSEASDLEGEWSCITTSTSLSESGESRCTADGLLYSKSGEITFNSGEKTWSYDSGTEGDGVTSCGWGASNGEFDVKLNHLILEGMVDGTSQVSALTLTHSKPSVINWISARSEMTSFVECSKIAVSPAPAGDLSATVTNNSITLTWLDQSDNESGFKVQNKVSATGVWSTVVITDENEVTYMENGLTSGAHWYRVVATNDTGDAISSSEVRVVIQ